MSFNEFVKQYQPQIEKNLNDKLGAETTNDSLLQAIRYAALNGGKRLRPLLTLAVVETFRKEPNQYLAVANAVELIHTYSLIHDDLPAMDDDDLRRGQPTVHRQYGEAVAILAGDALQALAFEWLINPVLTPFQQVELIQHLAQAAGAHGMVGGQYADMEATDQPEISVHELAKVHRGKTGSLLAYSFLAGGIIAELSVAAQTALSDFGFAFGLAFQIKDDLLDLKQDDAENKQSYPYLLGVDGAKFKLMEQLKKAQLSLQTLQLETKYEVDLLNDCLHYFDDMVEN